MSPPRTPPALILGTGITALGTLRALREAGVETYCLSTDPEWERFSRWYCQMPHAPTLPGPEHLASTLASLPLPQAVLFPCSDHMNRATSLLPAELRARFLVTQAAPPVLDQLISKRQFADALERYQIPRPVVVSAPTAESIRRIAQSELPHYFLKPTDSQGFFRAFGQKAFTFDSYIHAEEQLARARADGFELILQERIPGPATNYVYVEGFIDHVGTVRSTFTRRRLRMYPADFGNSTAMISIAPSSVQDAIASVHRLLRALGYVGIFSAECKRDPRDGLHKLIEINARPWWYISCPVRCGVNIALQAYQDALGQPVTTVEQFRVGYRMMNAYTDAVTMRARLRTGEISILGWINEWSRNGCTLFTGTDPMPGIRWLLSRASARVQRSVR